MRYSELVPSVQTESNRNSRLPLSWARKEISHPRLYHLTLPLSGYHWIHRADIPWHLSFPQVYHSEIAGLPGGFVMRGCMPEVRNFLIRQGCECLLIGSEAVLNLENPAIRKKSLWELNKRGLRRGRIVEVTNEPHAYRLFMALKRNSVHGKEPQLQHLFRDGWEEASRYFVFETPEQQWLGGISISRNNHDSWHTELILRIPGAPVGIMEALFHQVQLVLREEGYRYWSLGEVPFYGQGVQQSLKSKFAFHAGHLLKFAYRYDGLYRFKNKFSPQWQPLYVCASHRISWKMLLDLFVQSGYIRLAAYKLFHLLHGGNFIS